MIEYMARYIYQSRMFYVVEVIMAISVVMYTIVTLIFGAEYVDIFTVAEYIHNYWITETVLSVIFIPSLITAIGTFLNGYGWIDFRLIYTMMMVVSMIFLGIITFLSLGPGNLGWITFLALGAIAAVCRINVRAIDICGR